MSYVAHALERMDQRGFDVLDVKAVLRNGVIVGAIQAGRSEGEWKAKIVDKLDGTSRKMGVVTLVIRAQRLVIVTTEWEDR